jgi:hypothetical protein
MLNLKNDKQGVGDESGTTTTKRIDPSEIKPEMKVVCSNNDEFAVVDHMEGASAIKLNKDSQGVHHYIPLGWVTRVEDDQIHIDRGRNRAMREWSEKPSRF